MLFVSVLFGQKQKIDFLYNWLICLHYACSSCQLSSNFSSSFYNMLFLCLSLFPPLLFFIISLNSLSYSHTDNFFFFSIPRHSFYKSDICWFCLLLLIIIKILNLIIKNISHQMFLLFCFLIFENTFFLSFNKFHLSRNTADFHVLIFLDRQKKKSLRHNCEVYPDFNPSYAAIFTFSCPCITSLAILFLV